MGAIHNPSFNVDCSLFSPRLSGTNLLYLGALSHLPPQKSTDRAQDEIDECQSYMLCSQMLHVSVWRNPV